jgi:hypothetical protein
MSSTGLRWRTVCVTSKCSGVCSRDFTPCKVRSFTRGNALDDLARFWPCPRDKEAHGVLQHYENGQWVEVPSHD